MTEENKMKIVFAPGCFEDFEGTQEELDNLVSEIRNMFEGKTAEEIKAQSRQMTEEDFEELPEAEQMKLIRAFGDLPDERKLQ